MTTEPKTNTELSQEYESQSSLSSAMRINYKGPTGKESSWESDAHTKGPMCYGCCGPKCAASFVAIIAVLVICCCYVSRKSGPLCDYLYWPF